ncbi:10920_t:CDS:2, partial [Scutellospora calospora]
ILIYPLLVRYFEKRGENIDVASKKTKSIRIFILITLSILLSVGVVIQTPNAMAFVSERFGVYDSFIFIYPPFDWLPLVIYGVAFALFMSRHANDTSYNIRLNMKAAFILHALFLLIRIPGKFGNINPELLP